MLVATDPDALELIADVARSLAAPDAESVRAARDGSDGFDAALWQQITDAGWLLALQSEADGGTALGLDAVTTIARALGRAARPEPYVAAGVLAPALIAAGDHPCRGEHLAAIADGDCVGVAWHGDAEIDDDDRITGHARFTGVPGASGFVVAARRRGTLELHWLDAGSSGLTVNAECAADGSRSARLAFAATPSGGVVMTGAAAATALEEALDLARVATAAELLGVMDRALELTTEFLGQRKQFGMPIGAFQVLQHRTVDAWMQRQLTEAALRAALRTYFAPSATATARAAAASSVKARASAAATDVCATALQLHGAIGFTDEYDLGLYINRALTLAPWLGNAAEHRRRHLRLTEGADR